MNSCYFIVFFLKPLYSLAQLICQLALCVFHLVQSTEIQVPFFESRKINRISKEINNQFELKDYIEESNDGVLP